MLRNWLDKLRAWLVRQGLLPRAGVHYIGGSDTLPPPFSREEEAERIARLDAGDVSVRQELIEHNLRRVGPGIYLGHLVIVQYAATGKSKARVENLTLKDEMEKYK